MKREIRYGPEIIFSYLYRVTFTFDHKPNRGHCWLMGSMYTKSHEERWKGKAGVVRKSFSVIHVLRPLDHKINRGHPWHRCRDVTLARCRDVAMSRWRVVDNATSRQREMAKISHHTNLNQRHETQLSTFPLFKSSQIQPSIPGF